MTLPKSGPSYKTFERLLQGSYGLVHRVEMVDGKKSQQYALEETDLHDDKLHEELNEVRQINRERLKHENVVQYYNMWFNVDKVRIYITMEYCDNGSLRQHTFRCRELPEERQVALWCLQIAEGTKVTKVIPISSTFIRHNEA